MRKKPPRYVKGKFANAACDFDDVLSELGIKATVGYATSRRKKELFVYCEKREDTEKVPKQYGEFSVTVEHAGKIRPAEQD